MAITEQSNKKRRLEPASVSRQESFSDLLTQLEAEEDASEDSIETSNAWPRPAVPRYDVKRDAIIFQQIEIEEALEPVFGPVLRLFGVTQGGNSVLAHIHGFRPYFYVAAPSGFMNADLEKLKDAINAAVPANVVPVMSCVIKNAKSLWGYKGDERVPFIKITVADPKSLPKVKDKSSIERADETRH